MKQTITKKQLAELNEKGFEVLLKFILKKGYSFNGPALLSIGQMIEFLDEKGKLYSIQKVNKKSKGWEIYMHKDDWRCFSRELVDALWIMVRQELEK